MGDVKLLAQQIAERLFTNGQGQEADRLVLELPDKREGGGWCRKAVEAQIVEAIAANAPALTPKQEAAEEMAKALEAIAENEGESCSRCEGNGSLWADGKAHYPSDTVAIRPCPNCNGSGRIHADLQEIARAALAKAGQP